MNIKYITTAHKYRRHATCQDAIDERDRIRESIEETNPERAAALRVLTVIDEPNVTAVDRDLNGLKVWVASIEQAELGEEIQLFGLEADAWAYIETYVELNWERVAGRAKELDLLTTTASHRVDAYFEILNDAGKESEYYAVYQEQVQ